VSAILVSIQLGSAQGERPYCLDLRACASVSAGLIIFKRAAMTSFQLHGNLAKVTAACEPAL
jgi:hypothetical protein